MTRMRRRPDPAIWSGRIPVLGICYGLQLMAHELGGEVVPSAKREYGPASVQITSEDGLFRGIDREQPVWMSHGDTIVRPPEGFVPNRAERFERVRRVGRCGAWAVRHPVPPRGGPYAARQGDPAQLRGRYRRGRADLDADLLRRDDGGRHRAAGRVRACHLRPVRRRRFGGRRGAGASGHWRPADLHLRRPRADAQARVRAAAHHLRRAPGHEAGDGRRPGPIPPAAWRAWRIRSRSAASSATSSSASSRKRRSAWARSTSWCRARSIPMSSSRRPPRPRQRPRSRPITTSVACRPTCASA